MMNFYFAPGACSLASHVALEESGLPYEAHGISLLHGEQKTPEYLAINPLGKVPALVVHGELVTENVAIMVFVADCAPQAALLPQNPLGRAKAIGFLSWCSNTVHPSFRYIVRPELMIDDAAAQKAISSRSKEAFLLNCRQMEDRLTDSLWVCGDQFSVCDAYALAFVAWLVRLEIHEFPNMFRMAARAASRPAVARVLQREGCHAKMLQQIFPTLA